MSSLILSETDNFIDNFDPSETPQTLFDIYGEILCKDVLTIVHSYNIVWRSEVPCEEEDDLESKYVERVKWGGPKWNHLYEYEERSYETVNGTLLVHDLFCRRNGGWTRFRFFPNRVNQHKKRQNKRHQNKKRNNRRKNKITKWHYFDINEHLHFSVSCNFAMICPFLDDEIVQNEIVFIKVFYNGRREEIKIPYEGANKFDTIDFVFNKRYIVYRLTGEDCHSLLYFYDTVEKRVVTYLSLDGWVKLHQEEDLAEEGVKAPDCSDTFILATSDSVLRYTFDGNLVKHAFIADYIEKWVNAQEFAKKMAFFMLGIDPALLEIYYQVKLQKGVFNVIWTINVRGYDNPYVSRNMFGIKLIGF